MPDIRGHSGRDNGQGVVGHVRMAARDSGWGMVAMGNGRPGMRRLALAALAGVMLFAAPAIGFAQSKPQVRIAPRVLVEADIETPLIISIGPPDALPEKSYVQLRGLPETATLNEGHNISPGTWAIPLKSLATLTINAPGAATGTTEFVVRVVSVEGAVLAENKSSMIVAAGYVIGQRSASAGDPKMVTPPMPAQPPVPSPQVAAPQQRQALAAPQASQPPTPPPTSRNQLAPEEKAKLEKLVGLGNRHLGSGNIAAAREFFRRAADGGLAEGALLLATTYDPDELDAIKVQGLAPDTAEARRWYERARALGAVGVDARLARLAGR